MTSDEKPKSTFLSWSTAGRIGFTAIFFFWIYMIWTSTAGLDAKLNASAGKLTAIHSIQAEFNSEVQIWRDLLLSSTNQDTLNKNWQNYETQYQKVTALAQTIVPLIDPPAINTQFKAFIDAHAANHEQYKKSVDLLVKSNFDPHQAQDAIRGIERPLLEQLEAADVSMEDDRRRADRGLVEETRNDIEEKLIALAFLSILAVWLPKYME